MDHDHILINRILQGDHQAFKDLVVAHERLIYHILNGLLKDDKEAVDDLFQEVLIKVYNRLPSFQQKSKLSTWIGRITYNHCFNHLRRERRRPETNSLEDLNEVQIMDERIFDAPIDETAQLYKAIEKMPDQFRLILTLYHLDNLNYQEIGEVLKIAEGTVKSRLFRARKVLKDLLLKLDEHGG